MGYEIEISSSLNAPSMMKDKVIAKAYRCNCEYHIINMSWRVVVGRYIVSIIL